MLREQRDKHEDIPMVTQRQLSETELLLLTTPDDTEEAPWLVMPEFQWRVVTLFMSILQLYAARTGRRWHLAAELKIVMPRIVNTRTLDLVPDVMVVEADNAPRDSWHVDTEGQVPPFVLEVVTEDSLKRDLEDKPLLYAAMGVQEYAIFAPYRTDGGPILLGYRRSAAGQWGSWEVDQHGVLWSDVLDGLGLYAEDREWLRLYDAQGQRLQSEAEWAQQAEERAIAEEAARRQAEQRAAEAEAELARLRALLPPELLP